MHGRCLEVGGCSLGARGSGVERVPDSSEAAVAASGSVVTASKFAVSALSPPSLPRSPQLLPLSSRTHPRRLRPKRSGRGCHPGVGGSSLEASGPKVEPAICSLEVGGRYIAAREAPSIPREAPSIPKETSSTQEKASSNPRETFAVSASPSVVRTGAASDTTEGAVIST